MGASLFNKKLAHACAWCVHGRQSAYTEEILCPKRGITDRNDSCRHYRYDPLKRTPNRLVTNNDFKAEDFKL